MSEVIRAHSYASLLAHVGHKLELETWGHDEAFPYVTIICADCGKWLLQFHGENLVLLSDAPRDYWMVTATSWTVAQEELKALIRLLDQERNDIAHRRDQARKVLEYMEAGKEGSRE